jgi:cell division protein FtsI (penicillin-binding protein 3)
LRLGPQRLYSYMTNFGFGQRTAILFVGETPGRIEPPGSWSTLALTRAAFGQGVSVSQLQMTVAMCVIANDGRLMRPWLVNRIESSRGQILQQFRPRFVRAVVSPQTARQVKEALEAVVSPGGTGALAAMDHYTVAAKTGTAQKSDRSGYQRGRYYSSMIGFFPAETPQVVISVALDEPQNGYYAGTVVAPLFRSIAEQTAVCLCITPDKAPNRRAENLVVQAGTAASRSIPPASRHSARPTNAASPEMASISRP